MSPSARLAVLLVLAVGIFFLPSLPFEITNWDDDYYIELNPFIRNAANVPAAFTETYFGNYQPLTIASYAVDYTIGGLSPAIYRAQNIAWHCATAVLLALILRRFMANSELAFILALAWAMHPMRNESTIWLSERKDVLSGFFLLSAFYIRTTPPTRTSFIPNTLELLCLLLALLAKASAIIYAPLLLAHTLLLNRETLRARVPWLAAQFAICIGFAFIGIHAAKDDPLPPEYATIGARLAGAVYSPGDALLRTIAPFDLSPLHPRAFMPALASPKFLACAALTLASLAGALMLARKNPAASFGMFFFLIAIAPVSGLVPDGAHFVADRYSYLPAMGLMIALGAAIVASPEKWRAWIAGAALLPIVLSNPARQREVWRSTETLWGRVLEVYPEFSTARIKLEQERLEHGGRADAAAIAGVDGDFASTLRDEVLQRALMRSGDTRGAEALTNAMPDGAAKWRSMMLLASKRSMPETLRASEALLADPSATRDDPGLAAIALTQAGALGEAESIIEHHGARLSIVMARARGTLARKLASRGEFDRAQELIRAAFEVNPHDPEAILAVAEIGIANGAVPAARKRLSLIVEGRGLPGETLDALSEAFDLLDRFSAQRQ